jgi:hypothetical protein
VQDTINNSLAGLAEGKYLMSGKTVCAGMLDLDTYNGFTGEAQCSYVRPENLPALHEAMAMAESA